MDIATRDPREKIVIIWTFVFVCSIKIKTKLQISETKKTKKVVNINMKIGKYVPQFGFSRTGP